MASRPTYAAMLSPADLITEHTGNLGCPSASYTGWVPRMDGATAGDARNGTWWRGFNLSRAQAKVAGCLAFKLLRSLLGVAMLSGCAGGPECF
jgi:hypothetical protein